MGALLRGVKREQVRRGMVLASPGSMKAVKKFQAQVYVRAVLLYRSYNLVDSMRSSRCLQKMKAVATRLSWPTIVHSSS